jgi:hypothetical protein
MVQLLCSVRARRPSRKKGARENFV